VTPCQRRKGTGAQVKVVLVTAGAGVLDYSRDDLAGAVVALATPHVGDLDLAAAEAGHVPEWRESDDEIRVRMEIAARACNTILGVKGCDAIVVNTLRERHSIAAVLGRGREGSDSEDGGEDKLLGKHREKSIL